MDTKAEKATLVHKDDGQSMKFIPTSKGLYHHNLTSGDGGLWSFITTVADRADKYTHRYRIPSTTPGAEPPRDARDSGSARSHSMHLETSSSHRP